MTMAPTNRSLRFVSPKYSLPHKIPKSAEARFTLMAYGTSVSEKAIIWNVIEIPDNKPIGANIFAAFA